MSDSEMYMRSDFREGMPPRVFGSENEYTDNGNFSEKYMATPMPWGDMAGLQDLTTVMKKEHLVAMNDHYNLYDVTTTTGGRLYMDGVVLEYATPECRTPKELVLHERAGEIIVRETLERAAQMAKEPAVDVYKRSGYSSVVLPNGEYLMYEDSVGNHENYFSLNEFSQPDYQGRTMPERLGSSKNALQFADFLALRKIIDGVGMVTPNGFSLSQRPRAVDYHNFHGSTRHGHKRAFYQHGNRIEVRSGEGNKSDWATEFKYGLTSLVLRLIEHDKFPEHLMLADPVGDVLTLSRNPHGNVVLESGLLRPGIDVLKDMVEAAVELGEQYPEFPAYERKAARDFYTFYNDLHRVSLRDNDVAALSDRIDWAARFAYFVRRGATYDSMTTSNLGLVRDDLKWDQIGNRDIARRHFSKFGHTALDAVIPPPPKTRAEGRVRITKELFEAQKLDHSYWDEVMSNDHTTYRFDNPLSTEPTFISSRHILMSHDKEEESDVEDDDDDNFDEYFENYIGGY